MHKYLIACIKKIAYLSRNYSKSNTMNNILREINTSSGIKPGSELADRIRKKSISSIQTPFKVTNPITERHLQITMPLFQRKIDADFSAAIMEFNTAIKNLNIVLRSYILEELFEIHKSQMSSPEAAKVETNVLESQNALLVDSKADTN